MAKQYGLIKSDKSRVISRPSIFNSDSGSDNEPEKPTGISTLKKKERMAQEKAIAEDPTIYQYDELYDDMQSKRKESKLARKDLDRKPKYINKLLETAERRKRENERRIERQVQKEREQEGDMFKDKESFVTSAYRKKLEEMKELEEEEKREEYLESIGDVKKQSDLSGFYRHLYAQQVNFDDDEAPSKPASTPKTIDSVSNTDPVENTTRAPASKKRKYRKRENDDAKSNSEDEKVEKIKLEHLPSNIDADSDFSIDSESENSDSETKKKPAEVVEVKEEVKEEIKEIKEEPKEEEVKPEEEPKPKKPKRDIWKKRTVGDAFDEALKRFYERKAARLQAVT